MHARQTNLSVPGTNVLTLLYCLQAGVTYEDGCHVWICVPELGWVEYHPYSVASCSADPYWGHSLLIYIKIYNKWTKARSFHKAVAVCSGPAHPGILN
jgi:hypothetical protein